MKVGTAKLAEWLRVNKMKPYHFAKQIGKSASTISRILSGENCSNMETARLIENHTNGGVRLDDWLVEYNPPKKRAAKAK